MVYCFAGGALLSVLLTVLVDHFTGFRGVKDHPVYPLVRAIDDGQTLVQKKQWPELERWAQGIRFHGRARLAYLSADGEQRVLLGSDPVADPGLVASSLDSGHWIHHIESGEIQFIHPLTNHEGQPMGAFVGKVDAPEPDIMRSWAEASLRFGAGVATMILIAGLAGLLLGRRIVVPLSQLSKATSALAKGRYEYSPCHNSPTEFQQLSHSFRLMSLELEDKIQRLAEARRGAERAEHSRRDFLADVSHTLGTPLTSIHGWLEAIRQNLVPQEQMPAHLEKLIRQVEFVSKTSRRLLELSLWESVDPPLIASDFPLLEPVLEVAETLEDQLLGSSIHLNIEALSSQDRVRADRGLIREIFQVFMENAVDHSGGFCDLSIETRTHSDRLWVTVSDSGKGMTSQQAAAAQRRYYSRRGSGLGLAIARRLVKAHGGSLTLRSQIGIGTQLHFDLPLAIEPSNSVPNARLVGAGVV